MQTTRLSSKGQLIIPKKIRDTHNWHAGLKFFITNFDGGIILKPTKPSNRTDIKELIGCVGYKGPRKSLQDMEAGIAKGAKQNK